MCENVRGHLFHLTCSLCLQQIKAIMESGVNVIVTGGKIGDLAQHYCNKYKVMVIRLLSKWDVRRLCKSIGATALPKIVSEYIFCVCWLDLYVPCFCSFIDFRHEILQERSFEKCICL